MPNKTADINKGSRAWTLQVWKMIFQSMACWRWLSICCLIYSIPMYIARKSKMPYSPKPTSTIWAATNQNALYGLKATGLAVRCGCGVYWAEMPNNHTVEFHWYNHYNNTQ